jgi:hypothetical protein
LKLGTKSMLIELDAPNEGMTPNVGRACLVSD